MGLVVRLEGNTPTKRRIQEVLTARLPLWFGQDEPNRHYAGQAERLDGWVARLDGRAVGLLLLKQHDADSAEIYWLGVDPDYHRQGVGQALVKTVEASLRADKVKILLVTTLHPDVDYEPYGWTRSFYEALGFEYASSTNEGPTGPATDPLACYRKAL